MLLHQINLNLKQKLTSEIKNESNKKIKDLEAKIQSAEKNKKNAAKPVSKCSVFSDNRAMSLRCEQLE